MVSLPRGIAPELLLSQVKNTMPYLLDGDIQAEALNRFPPSLVLREYGENPERELDHYEYFRLCLSSHYLTCATPVPTDVDNQIRQKLWPKQLPLETALRMAELVLESRRWDFTIVTRRFSTGAQGSPWEKETLSGHLGEWFTVACGAYCGLGRFQDAEACAMRSRLFDEIGDEVRRHSEIFGSLWRGGDGLGALKASASVAHNFGDLDRVMDMWELSVGDPLRLEFYKLAVQPFDQNRKLRHMGRLWVAGELYKSVIDGSSMALENHRHYALRKPRFLRQAPDLMITTGPFFDAWGVLVAKHSESPDEIVRTLKEAWVRQPKTWGYGRALCGIFSVHPGLSADGLSRERELRVALNTPQERFERQWADEALRLMDEIPSRA